MSSNPMYTVHHQSYWVPGRPGQAPEIVRKAQWVQVPPSQLGTAQQAPWAAYVGNPQSPYISEAQGTYYRVNPAGTLSEFSYPAYKPTVGAGNWDPAKPMPVHEYFAQGGQKPFR